MKLCAMLPAGSTPDSHARLKLQTSPPIMLALLSVVPLLLVAAWMVFELRSGTRSRVVLGLAALCAVAVTAFMWGRFVEGFKQTTFPVPHESPIDAARMDAKTAPGLQAPETEGLFVAGVERMMPEPELQDGDLLFRLKAVRLHLTRAVLRSDTEDKGRYWLEIDISPSGAPRNPDPGDFYRFRIDGKDHGGFSTRGQLADGGWRWALGVTDPAEGRILLAKIGKAYGLAEGQIQDQTRESGQ